MVKCRKLALKAFAKGNCLGLQKYSFSLFLLLNVTFWPISGMFISSFGSWAGQDFLQRPSLRYRVFGFLGSPNVRNCLFRNHRFISFGLREREFDCWLAVRAPARKSYLRASRKKTGPGKQTREARKNKCTLSTELTCLRPAKNKCHPERKRSRKGQIPVVA